MDYRACLSPLPHRRDEAELARDLYRYLAVDGRRNRKSIRRIAIRLAFLDTAELTKGPPDGEAGGLEGKPLDG